MPRLTRRGVVAAVALGTLTLSLLPAAAASAASAPTYRSVRIMFHDVGKAPTLRGNTHFGDLQVNRAADGTTTVAGQLADYDCADGVYFHVYSFGREDTLCPRVHTWVVASSSGIQLTLNPQTLDGTRLTGVLELTSLRGDSVRTFALDFTFTGTDPAVKYVNTDPVAGTRTVTRIRPGTTAGTFGPLTLDDLKRDNQITELRSDIYQGT
jgi:hypothetical protein